MKQFNPYLKNIEWETLDESHKITRIQKSQYTDEQTKMIELWRDGQYRLQGIIHGKVKRANKAKPGTILAPFSLNGYTDTVFSTEINHCYMVSSYASTDPKTFELVHKTEFKPYEVKINYTFEKTEVNSITEWYINGPNANFMFPDRIDVQKDIKHSYCHVQNGIEGETKTYFGGQESSDINCAFIELDDFSFNIKEVPKMFGPDWSHNYAIQYRNKWGGFPDKETRKRIRFFLSFIFGRQLLNIGNSCYDKNDNIINETLYDPNGSDIKNRCSKSSIYPINIDDYNHIGKFKDVTQELLPIFLELYDELNFEQVLWFYWSTFDLPVGLELPIITATIETLSKSWFKSSKTKLNPVYLDKATYRNLIKNELESLDKKLNDIPCAYKTIILSKILNANQWTVSDRLNKFFEEIGLNIGNTEKYVLKMRNKPAHGGIMGQSNEDILTLIDLKRAAQTFLHRIILKLLEYKGEYIDYLEIGFPSKNINTPITILNDSEQSNSIL